MGDLAALAARLRGVVAGTYRPAAAQAAASKLDAHAKTATAEHIRTGRLHAETAARVAGDGGVELVGPDYLPFVKGLEIAHGFTEAQRAEARDAYASEIHKAIQGGT